MNISRPSRLGFFFWIPEKPIDILIKTNIIMNVARSYEIACPIGPRGERIEGMTMKDKLRVHDEIVKENERKLQDWKEKEAKA